MSADGGTAVGPLTVGLVVAKIRTELGQAGIETADLDARLIVADAFGLGPAGLILRQDDRVEKADADRLAGHLARRLAGEPVHRILGRRPFYNHEFGLSQATLEPRPDTEALVDLCRRPMAAVIADKGSCRFADVGTGTGAIAVSLLALFPQSSAIAIDLVPEALATALRNASAAGVADRFAAVAMDHLSALSGPVDLVVSNPPYVRTGDLAGLPPAVREFDPLLALDGGGDGLRSYRALARQSAGCLLPGGHVLVEIGAGQGRDVAAIFEREGLVLAASAEDLGGTQRALWFRKDTEATLVLSDRSRVRGSAEA